MPLPIPQPQAMNPVVSRLFTAVNNNKPVTTNKIVGKGSLITFGYSLWKHDPYPLVIVTDYVPNQRLRGVNLHYLSFPYIRNLLRQGANNAGFSYQNIKADAYITHAFRSYKWNGIRQVKMLDANFILTVMASVRSFDPTQVAAIRRQVQEQIQQMINPKATPGPVTNLDQQKV